VQWKHFKDGKGSWNVNSKELCDKKKTEVLKQRCDKRMIISNEMLEHMGGHML